MACTPVRPTRSRSGALCAAVGGAAIVASALNCVTDAKESYHHGFTTSQLWLNYLALLPMPWLLSSICAVHDDEPEALGLIGALLYGATFT